jgi:hypothetical protein
MAGGELQGWCRDPFGLHEERYFSAGGPTKLVRDGGVDSYDEPPSTTYDIAAVAASPAYVRDDLYLPDSPPGSPKRSHGWAIAAVAIVAVGAIVAVIALGSGSKPPASASKPAISPAAFVAQSTRYTLAKHTVRVSLTGTLSAAGESISVTGTAEIDLSANAMALNLSLSASGRSVLEKEILVRGNLYLSTTSNGQSFASVTGGRHWMRIPAQHSATPDLSASALLAALEHNGMTVRALGTKTIAGRSCSGYAVSPGKQAGTAAAQIAMAQFTMGQSAAGQIAAAQTAGGQPGGSSSAAPGAAQLTFIVWFDAQGLLCQLSAGYQDGSSSAASGSLVLSFSNWGSPVHVTAPPPSDTFSAQDFLRKLTGSDGLFCGTGGEGAKRFPVKAVVNDYAWRTSVARMGGEFLVGLNREVRAGAGVEAGDEVEVVTELDAAPREVEIPPALAQALAADPPAQAAFDAMAFTHRKEYARWIADAKQALDMVRAGRTRS